MYESIKFHHDQIIIIVATASCAGWNYHPSLAEANPGSDDQSLQKCSTTNNVSTPALVIQVGIYNQAA